MNVELDWKVIDSYFSSKLNEKYITKHHITSYNSFLNKKLPYIIKTLNPFTIVKNDEQQKKRYEINVYMGGKNGEKIVLQKPCVLENNKQIILFPNLARLKDYTYTSDLLVDVLIEYTTYNEDGTKTVSESIENNVSIGTIPVMLHSNACVLNKTTMENRVQLGECPYDQGGYFIIDGKEKVIVSQERVATNKLFLNYVKSTDTVKSEYTHMGLIRCTSQENSLFPKTIKLMIFGKDVQEGARFKSIVMSVPNIELQNIPLFIMFRALGIESDKEIIRNIFLQDTDIDDRYLEYIRKSVHEGSIVTTQKEAIDYLARYCKYKEPNYVKHVLKNDVFPNIGYSFKTKGTYLGYLALKLIRFGLNELDETNRDSYLYKRVDVSGILMANMFRDGYNQLRNNIKNRIDREYIYGSWKDMDEFKMVVKSSMNTIFDKQIITSFVRRSFKGKWGMRESEGIVQDVNRLSYLGYISHIRRVNTPMDRSLKLVTPHRSDASQWGYMCPIESPDGENIGLLKHLATGCQISEECDQDAMVECLQNNGVNLINDIYPTNLYNKTKVLLNNNWIGIHNDPHDLVSTLRVLKQNGIINIHTSISWNIIENEVEIFNDSGRCVRPVYIANAKMQEKTFSIISDKDKDDKWKHLISNNVHKSDKASASKDYKENELNKNMAPIEYIDSTETSRSLIAMNREDIALNKMNKYDYIEIHPSLVLSMYTNVIPLAHHNQAPRNIFSGQQGKQALGVYASNFNHRIDTASYLLHYPQKGLLTTKYAKYAHIDKLPNGENVIVAIATYTGYNQEDSLIINKNSLERGLFNSSIYKSHIESEDSNENNGEYISFQNPLEMLKGGLNVNVKYAKWDKIDKNGLPLENKYIEEDDVYVGKVKTTIKTQDFDETLERIRNDTNTDSNKLTTYTDKSVIADFTNGGMIDKVIVYQKNDIKKLKIRFRKTREPVLGDKFASRHGQKGVIGMILPQEDMPFTKEGIVPDLIVNPHAFPSRMTIGHLIESVLAKYACVSGNTIDGTVFEDCDIGSYFDLLGKRGFQKHGDELLYNGFTGEQINTEIFFGPTFYYRLKHMVNDKMNYRGGNDPSKTPVTGTTRQPTHGRANKGGLRIGEMETNALIAHGIGSFIKESMMERSDKYKYAIDVDTGSMAIPHKHGYKSLIDVENNKNFTHVETPYTFKLMNQEVNALGIKSTLCVKKCKKEEEEDVEEDILFYTSDEEQTGSNELTE